MDVPDVVDAAATVADSRPVDIAARIGLAARGAIWIVIGTLAVSLGLGRSSQHVDQRGALSELLAEPFGGFLVAFLAVGFAAYALWRFSEAAFGVTGENPAKTGPRLQSFARGLAYAVLCATAVSVLLGSQPSQSAQQRSLTAQVMDHAGGRLLVGLVGLAVVVIGAVMIYEGWTAKFMRYFRADSEGVRRTAKRLGRIGTIGRGAVFVLVGLLVIAAAVSTSPSKAGGIDTAIRTLLKEPFGGALVVIAGLMLVTFGIYGLFEARYRRV